MDVLFVKNKGVNPPKRSPALSNLTQASMNTLPSSTRAPRLRHFTHPSLKLVYSGVKQLIEGLGVENFSELAAGRVVGGCL